MTANPLMLEDLGAIVLRRRLHLAIPAAVIMLITGALALFLPSVYVSKATILIEQPEISQELVATTVTGYAAERISIVRNRVMTRDNLWAIAEKYDLYPQDRTIENQQDIVARLRQDVALSLVSEDQVDLRGRSITTTIAFTISYESESPELAQQVTTEIANLYLGENLRSRTEHARQTSAFLNDEAKRLNEQISALESKIADFKVKNAAYLPDSFAAANRTLESAQQQRAALVAKLGSLEARYSYLRSQLSGSGQLGQARAELNAAREKYSEIHPDVVRLKRTVEALEAGGGSTASTVDPALLSLQSESYEVAGNISVARKQLADLDREIADYQSRLAQAPEAEREYTALIRDLELATTKYREIMGKLTGAQLAEELEREQKGERFTLSAPATYPSEPSKPNRLAVMLLGVVFALAAGVSTAFLAEYFDHRILGPKELAAVFKAPPLAMIPEIPAVGTGR
jgi:polysaccharide biosynthesis transport protein